ncbi:MAG: S8 family serine peptidase [Bacilli bacterium]|nr:S8 family serine peptidase [Bacilli bacterium]
MIKVTMLATLLAGIAMGTNIAVDANPYRKAETRDARIIVEVDRSLESLTKDGIRNVQNSLLNSIKQNVTSNIKLISSYTVLNNAFAISINSDYIEAVKSLPGVKSVTVDEVHFVTPLVESVSDDGEGHSASDYGGSDNASAETMHKPDDTNDGEGTVVAILDNEFYFRAKTDSSEAWNHETFTDLDPSVKVRFESRPDITDTHVYNVHVDDQSSKPYRWRTAIDNATLGEEGSLYFNRKVPFYFDYGGEREYYGGGYNEDFDVSSVISYHGSHVASITAGNADNYKGIAPKAQLVCMKVFTNFEASRVDRALGFQNSSGAYDIPILNALEDCIILGVDGINMSLGSNLDDFDSDSITVKTLTRLANEGILSSISAGNSGKSSYTFAGGYGNWTSEMVETGILSGYANSKSSMTVAAGQPAKTFYSSAFKYNGKNISYQDQVVNVGNSTDYEEEEERKISDLVTEGSKTLNWVYIPNFGSSADYTDKDVSGKIAIVNRGSIDFATKVTVAKDKGAIGVVIINNDPTANDFNFRCSFGDLKPTIPVALVLFKDKKTFEVAGKGQFDVVKDEVDVNPKANTMSTFSSDGATYDLDLKPEITAPGENIRGAVPPQKKEDKTPARRYSTYEFLSGTSMSAPNYAGAQSVVLSKKAVELKNNKADYIAYRKTVDMRLMSTAIPMIDYELAPEINSKYDSPVVIEDDMERGGYQSSPRLQGAGMANIGGAYTTDVYLEGLDLQGNPTNKSKIALRNNSEINAGNVSLKFIAHNESNENRTYKASYTVMRPAIKQANEIVSRNHNYRGEVDAISSFSGMSYWVEEYDTHGQKSLVERHATGDINVGDVFKVSREIKYNIIDPDNPNELKEQSISIGRYICTEIIDSKDVINPATGKTETWKYAKFEEYGSTSYQSTQDYLIDVVEISQDIVVAPGDHEITLQSYSLTNEEREKIASFYKYGCYLEGFVSLKSQDGHVDLSMPWMGFYGGGNGQTYESAPVTEPFNFEKDDSTIYPSELVNDIAYSLIGKANVDMGSTWVTTFVEPGTSFNENDILSNDDSLTHLAKTNSNFHLLGTDSEGNYYDNPSENLYAGNAHTSNTMLVQQFVLRSVDDNYYTITNKETGEVVLTDALQDMLFGQRYGRYPLYKSHVDDSYLGAGYVSHRAFGVIPLYDLKTGRSFESGDYEIKFNYLLAGTRTWVSQAYTIHLDSDDPTIKDINVGTDSIKINIEEKNLVSVKLGSNYYELSEEEKNGSYIQLNIEDVKEELDNNMNEVYGTGRLYIELLDKAYGRTGAIIRFGETSDGKTDFTKYTIVEHYSFILGNDFEDLGKSIEFVIYDATNFSNKTIDVDSYVRVKRSTDGATTSGGGCGGNITTTSILLASLAGALALIVAFARRRKILGGKE